MQLKKSPIPLHKSIYAPLKRERRNTKKGKFQREREREKTVFNWQRRVFAQRKVKITIERKAIKMSTAIMQSGAFYDFGDLLLKVSWSCIWHPYFSISIIADFIYFIDGLWCMVRVSHHQRQWLWTYALLWNIISHFHWN